MKIIEIWMALDALEGAKTRRDFMEEVVWIKQSYLITNSHVYYVLIVYIKQTTTITEDMHQFS